MPARILSLLTRAQPGSVLLAPLTTEAAVLRALLYADVFDYALTLEQLRRYATGEPASDGEVREALDSQWLKPRVERRGEFVTLAGRVELVAARGERAAHSARLWEAAARWGALVAHLPFVRMVAVTGALAMDNSASPGDDIDFMIVALPGRVWLARAAAIAAVYAARLFGVQLCPNFILDTGSLAQSRRDLFVAHELAQMIPLSGLALYSDMRAANGWAQALLPNADSLPRAVGDRSPRGAGLAAQRLMEWALGGRLGDALERWEHRRKLRKFGVQIMNGSPAAVIDARQIKGHFNDYGQRALAEYETRCRRYGIAPWP